MGCGACRGCAGPGDFEPPCCPVAETDDANESLPEPPWAVRREGCANGPAEHAFEQEDLLVEKFTFTETQVAGPCEQSEAADEDSPECSRHEGVGIQAVAMYDFAPDMGNWPYETQLPLEFKKGQLVQVLGRDDDTGEWGFGHLVSQPTVLGHFPLNYVNLVGDVDVVVLDMMMAPVPSAGASTAAADESSERGGTCRRSFVDMTGSSDDESGASNPRASCLERTLALARPVEATFLDSGTQTDHPFAVNTAASAAADTTITSSDGGFCLTPSEEPPRVVRKLTSSQPVRRGTPFSEMDVDGDGVVTREDYALYLKNKMAASGGEEKSSTRFARAGSPADDGRNGQFGATALESAGVGASTPPQPPPLRHPPASSMVLPPVPRPPPRLL